jgi:hypothetical protein
VGGYELDLSGSGYGPEVSSCEASKAVSFCTSWTTIRLSRRTCSVELVTCIVCACWTAMPRSHAHLPIIVTRMIWSSLPHTTEPARSVTRRCDHTPHSRTDRTSFIGRVLWYTPCIGSGRGYASKITFWWSFKPAKLWLSVKMQLSLKRNSKRKCQKVKELLCPLNNSMNGLESGILTSVEQHLQINIVFMKRLRADKIQGMLATIRSRVFCHLACCPGM